MEPHNEHSPLDRIPIDLQEHAQWVVWRYGEMQAHGKRKKPIYNPATGRPAKTNDRSTHADFARAAWALTMDSYQGLGFVLERSDPFTCIDLDHCRDAETGQITPQAEEIIRRFDTYTEVSPSGEGVHIWVRGVLSGGNRKREEAEVYSHSRYITVTGQHLAETPTAIQERQAELNAWYAETYPADRETNEQRRPRVLHYTTLSDDEVLSKARTATNGVAFERLMEGDTSAHDGDDSAADQALCNHLAFWTQDEDQIDRLFRTSGLYREDKWDTKRRGTTYGAQTIAKALAYVSSSYTGECQRESHTEQRITHVYPWQQREETPKERAAYLQELADGAKERVRGHIEAGDSTPLLITLPPGVGKTRTVAELGADHDLAWIAERHDMAESVMRAHPYRHIHACSPGTCPDHHLHAAIVGKGYNAWPLHKGHQCAYFLQHQEEGSAFYQIGHVPTVYPKKHEAAIVDELNLPNWLIDHTISAEQVRQTRDKLYYYQDAEKTLLDGLSEVFREVGRAPGGVLHGKALFDALDQNCADKLEASIESIAASEYSMQPRPTLFAYDSDSVAKILDACGPVIIPQIVRALQVELSNWKTGQEWNSRLRITRDQVHILEPHRFNLADGQTLPLVILDATAHEDLVARLLVPLQDG